MARKEKKKKLSQALVILLDQLMMFPKLLCLSALNKLTTVVRLMSSKIGKMIAKIPLHYDDCLDGVKLPHSGEILSFLFQNLRGNRSHTRKQSAV